MPRSMPATVTQSIDSAVVGILLASWLPLPCTATRALPINCTESNGRSFIFNIDRLLSGAVLRDTRATSEARLAAGGRQDIRYSACA